MAYTGACTCAACAQLNPRQRFSGFQSSIRTYRAAAAHHGGMRIVTTWLLVLLLTLVLAQPAPGQDLAPTEVSGGYQMQQVGSTWLRSGWYGDGSFPINRHTAVVVEAASAV